MVFGIRVSYTSSHAPSPMCPCSSCWNAAPAAYAPQCPCGQCWENSPVVSYPQQQQQQQQQQQRPATPKSASTSSSKKSHHLSRLLRKSSKASIRSDMVPLAASETRATSDSASEKSSILSYKQ